jgi:hypothetical protein
VTKLTRTDIPPFFERHQGPFQLVVYRPGTRKTQGVSGGLLHTREVLSGSVAGDEVEEEALSLMGDPRDTIDMVEVWSEMEQQHVMTYRKGDQ